MGCVPNHNDHRDVLKIATLNYSGILLSPYEFYASEEENKVISKCSETFFKLAEKEFPEFAEKSKFKWEMGKIDTIWQKERYSPIYSPTCGIKNNVYLVDEKEFIQQWDYTFEKCSKIKQKLAEEYTEEQFQFFLKKCRTFDLLCYKTLLKEIYDLDDIEVVTVKAKKYKEHQRSIFAKNFLNQKEKAKLIIEALNKDKIDIMFLQEVTNEVLNEIEKHTNNYRICKPNIKIHQEDDCKSVILIRQTKFPELRCLKEENNIFYRNFKELKSKNTQQQTICKDDLQDLNFNKDTVIQVLGNLILICPHLSSKQENNKKQITQLKTNLYRLKLWFPQYSLICAGDLNGRFEMGPYESEFGHTIDINGEKVNLNENQTMRDIIQNTNFAVFPEHQQGITSKKKRTMMQAQRKKADEFIQGTKDYIITDLQLLDSKIQTIKGQQIEGDHEEIAFLPNKDHPYDHFLVSGKVQLQRPIKHCHQAQVLLKYSPNKLTHEQLEQLEGQLAK